MPPIPTLPEDRSTCTPCRGTGTVISGLGGTPHEEKCPWCEGTGRWTPPAPVPEEDTAGS
ncbi:MAG: hypothetical protein H0U80_05615 [Solirubrobacterales bacterium]|nr:hypothetical protein [Solirubrobacterales bacterium]